MALTPKTITVNVTPHLEADEEFRAKLEHTLALLDEVHAKLDEVNDLLYEAKTETPELRTWKEVLRDALGQRHGL